MIVNITKNKNLPDEILNSEELEHNLNASIEGISRGFLFPGISEFRVYEYLDLSNLVISIKSGFKLTLVSPCVLNNTTFRCDNESLDDSKPTMITICDGSIGAYKVEGEHFEVQLQSAVWNNEYDSSDEELYLIAETLPDSEN